MKKTLTENISRYDDKMRLRMDWKTARALIISALPAALIGWFFSSTSIMVGIPIGVFVFLAAAMFQLGMINGIPLYSYTIRILQQNKRRKLKYVYTDAERITLRDPETEENDVKDEKKRKQKKDRKQKEKR